MPESLVMVRRFTAAVTVLGCAVLVVKLQASGITMHFSGRTPLW